MDSSRNRSPDGRGCPDGVTFSIGTEGATKQWKETYKLIAESTTKWWTNVIGRRPKV